MPRNRRVLVIRLLGLSEVRWSGSGTTKTLNKTLCYSGSNEPYHRNGVGVILDKKFNRAVVNVVPVPDWNLLIQLSGKPITINIIQRCAPTAGKLIKGLEGCYKELVKVTTVTIKEKQDLTFIMGDFNAKLCQGSVGPNCRAWAG
ncbi:hypothetical protein HUJ05_013221 [Dendroctonus ponderosae]|nr:hypothetical protein HUJ05_013221 [Dendroctonus ponderosae]